MKSYYVRAEWPNPFAYENCIDEFFVDAESKADATQKVLDNITREDCGPSSADEVKTTVRRVTW